MLAIAPQFAPRWRTVPEFHPAPHRVRVEFLAGRLLLAFYSSFRWTPTFSVLLGFAGLLSNTFSVLLEIAIDAARDVPATLHHNLGAFFRSSIPVALPPVMLPNSSTGKRLQPRSVFTASSSRTISSPADPGDAPIVERMTRKRPWQAPQQAFTG